MLMRERERETKGRREVWGLRESPPRACCCWPICFSVMSVRISRGRSLRWKKNRMEQLQRCRPEREGSVRGRVTMSLFFTGLKCSVIQGPSMVSMIELVGHGSVFLLLSLGLSENWTGDVGEDTRLMVCWVYTSKEKGFDGAIRWLDVGYNSVGLVSFREKLGPNQINLV